MNVALVAPRNRMSGEARCQQVVETVLDLVAERGADDVSVQAIADRIGVSQPAIFRHFSTKEAIWIGVMEWLEERLSGIYQSATNVPMSPLAALQQIFMEHVRLIEGHPALAKIVFSDHLRLRYPGLQTRFDLITNAYGKRLDGLIEEAKGDGLIDAALKTGEVATLFLCMIQGLGFQFAIAQRRMDLPQEADRIFALYLRAIGRVGSSAA